MGDYFKTYENFNNMQDKKYTIFCDMDGVLTNFVKRFKEIEANTKSLSPKEYDAEHGQWSIWRLIDPEGVTWWSQMEWMPDGQQLWQYLMPHKPTILSAPSRNPDSRNGKHIWIKNNLGIKQGFYTVNPAKWKPHYRIILNTQKHKFCRGKYDILIDDTKKKIDLWRAAGGTAIHHKNTEDTIAQLKEIMSV